METNHEVGISYGGALKATTQPFGNSFIFSDPKSKWGREALSCRLLSSPSHVGSKAVLRKLEIG